VSFAGMFVTYDAAGEYGGQIEDLTPKAVSMPDSTTVGPADIIAKARSFKGQLTDGPDVPRMAREIGEHYPEMAEYARGIGQDTPWCGVFNAYVHTLLGIRPAYTKNSTDYDDFAWADAPIEGRWGTIVTQGQALPGDTVVLRVPHHITFLDHDNGDGTFNGTGGNQSNAVTTARFNWGNVRGVVRAPGAGAMALPAISKPTAQFEKCVALLLVHEGGNDDDPRDPGGRTSRGILQREWDAWRQSHPGLPSDVWQAPQDQVLAIYRAKYWDAMSCDDLPAGVDYAVFDYGVNSGIGRGAKVLQRIVGTDVDGEIGPLTIAATARVEPRGLIGQICDERLAFLQGLGTWPVFGNGWSRRVREVRAAALEMAAIPKPIGTPPMPKATDPGQVSIIPPGQQIDVQQLAQQISLMAQQISMLISLFGQIQPIIAQLRQPLLTPPVTVPEPVEPAPKHIALVMRDPGGKVARLPLRDPSKRDHYIAKYEARGYTFLRSEPL